MIRLATGLALLALIVVGMAGAARAAPVDQAGWSDRKQVAELRNGQRIAWVEMGDPDAPPLVLLHGWTDTSRAWSLVAPALAERHRLIMPDLRGHGGSAAPACCYALADFADDVALLMDALGIERASLAGHSLGSMIAQRFAAEHPGRVDRLVLIGSTALAPLAHGDALWTAALGIAEPLDPAADPFLADWLAQVDLPAAGPAFAAHAEAEILAVPPHVWHAVARELADVPVGRLAADVAAPVLILAGGRDALFGAEHHASLRAAYPQGRYREYPELGHNLIYEGPEAIAAAMREFLVE